MLVRLGCFSVLRCRLVPGFYSLLLGSRVAFAVSLNRFLELFFFEIFFIAIIIDGTPQSWHLSIARSIGNHLSLHSLGCEASKQAS